MIIQHYMAEAFTNRQLGIIRKKKSKLAEKLGSGYQLNRAADNAASMSISEKMRGQIRGLEQASRNIQDGISLIQTEEGRLNEVHSILHRIRELSVQAATDTYTNGDRKKIQKEVNELLNEVDRIAEDTEFNQIKVLKGKEALETDSGFTDVTGSAVGSLPKWVKRTNDGYLSDTITTTYTQKKVVVNGNILSSKYITNGTSPIETTTYSMTNQGNTYRRKI